MLSALSTFTPLPPAHDTAEGLRRQLHLRPEPLRPGMLPVQRDVRWIADTLLEKLQSYAGSSQELQPIRALHQTLTHSEPQLEVSADELPGFYAFFKQAEHLLERHRSRGNPQIEADYSLCRALKWQFRAAVGEARHTHQAPARLRSLADVSAGDKRSSHYHLGYDFMLEPSRQLSAGPCLTNDSHLEITRDQRVERSRVIALQGKLKSIALNLGQSQSRSQLSLGYFSSKEYASLAHYADVPGSTLQRQRDYSALSQPGVRQALAENGLGDIELPCLYDTPGPLKTEKGFIISARSDVAVDVFSFLKLNSAMDLTLRRTYPHKALDILGLYDTSATMAARKLTPLPPDGDTPERLLDDMKRLAASGSRHFMQKLSTPAHHTQQAQALLERYVRLKLQAPVDPGLDRQILDVIQQHRALLRPDAVKVYTLASHAQVLSGSVSATASAQGEGGKGVSIEVSHRKLDDPHLSGDYLSIDIAPLQGAQVIKTTLRNGLSAIGQQTFDWEQLVQSISASLLDPAKRAVTQVLVKIKHGQPVVLLTRHTLSKANDLRLPPVVNHYTGFDLQSLRTRQQLRSEQLGSDSLDQVLPIARRLLPERPAWDQYVKQHAEAFQTLLDSIGQQKTGSVLGAELDELARISPALRQAVESLRLLTATASGTPTQENRALAQEALVQMLLDYLPHYEARVSTAWTLR